MDVKAQPLPIPPEYLQPQPQPQPTQQGISIHDIITIRVTLDQCKTKSPTLDKSIAHLDRIILTFTESLNQQGPAR